MSVAPRKPSLLESMGLGGTAAMFAVNFTQYVPLVGLFWSLPPMCFAGAVVLILLFVYFSRHHVTLRRHFFAFWT